MNFSIYEKIENNGRKFGRKSVTSIFYRKIPLIKRLNPGHLLLTHLYDLHRKERDRRTYKHALWIKDALRDSGIQVTIPVPGETESI